MMKIRNLVIICAGMIVTTSMVPAQELVNVKVLPFKTKKETSQYMKTKVAKSLGVKCNFCHDPKNFADDSNPHKIAARGMMQMTNDINEQLRSIGKTAIEAGMKHWESPAVDCWLCHRGSAEPEMTGK